MIKLFNKFKNITSELPKATNRVKQFSPLNFKSQFRQSSIDKYLNRLSKPLYYYIIGANLGIFLLWNLPIVDQNFMYNNFTLSADALRSGRFHTIITHAFSQYNLIHLGFNMITFYYFGQAIEYTFGSKRLLIVFLAGLLGGAFSSNLEHGAHYLGASAAVNAVLTYYICTFPNNMMFFFMIPVPAWAVGLIILFQSWSLAGQNGNGGHLGGMIAGSACYFFFRMRPF